MSDVILMAKVQIDRILRIIICPQTLENAHKISKNN